MVKTSMIGLARFLLVALLLSALAWAVMAAPPPPTAQAPGLLDTLVLPPIDAAALRAAEFQRRAPARPPHFALPATVRLTPHDAGTWQRLPGDRLFWQLRLVAPGALSLNLGFRHYRMPPGGQLWLSNPQGDVRGPFTEADNEAHGELWTPILPGDELTVTLSLPEAALADLALELSAVNRGFEDWNATASGTCLVDVVCPAGDDWRDETRAVALISIDGLARCTAFLVNNTAQDLRPYLLTAAHCDVDAANAASVVAYWNYDHSTCRPLDSVENGLPGDGTLDQYTSGAIWRAGYVESDFTLLELDDSPDPAFNVHWAGWDRSGAAVAAAVTIHHASSAEKRISLEYQPTTVTSWWCTDVPGNGTHIRVADWDLGSTEPGSSGAPLFDPAHHVIGQLHGGLASCDNDESDWYGRLAFSWVGNGTPQTRLQDWLDPLGSGVLTLDGRDRALGPFTLDVIPPQLGVCVPSVALYQATVDTAVDYRQPVTLTVDGVPPGALAFWSANPLVPPAASRLTITPTAAAAPGRYPLAITARSSTHTQSFTATLDLYDTVPVTLAVPLAPLDGATAQPLFPVLEWPVLPYDLRYDVQLAPHPLLAVPLLDVANLLQPRYALDATLEQGRCYWWHVRAENACGAGDWSPLFSFATEPLAMFLSDDLESGSPNWSHQALLGSDRWTLTTTHSHSPAYAWFVPDDSIITDSRLWLSQPIAVDASSRLTFWHRYRLDATLTGCYDGAVLEVSTDGSVWRDLGSHITAGGYNDTLATCTENPLSGRQAWTGEQEEWTQVVVDLGSFAGQSIYLRWRLGCDNAQGVEGWAIDDVQIASSLPPAALSVVEAVSPTVGSTLEETPLRITGSDLVGNPQARLGNTWLLSAMLVDSTTLEAVVPLGIAEGVHTLTLFNGDCRTVTLTDVYTAAAICRPVAGVDWSATPATLRAGEAISFRLALTRGTPPLTVTWDFGDGSPPQSGSPLLHTFPVTQTVQPYTVILTVANPCTDPPLALIRPVLVLPPLDHLYLPLLLRAWIADKIGGAMLSRERLLTALDHREPDRVPIDLGASLVTGINAVTYRRLKEYLGLDGEPVRVADIVLQLAQVEEPLRRRFGVDVIGLPLLEPLPGVRNTRWQPWTLPDGSPALISADFAPEVSERGDLLIRAADGSIAQWMAAGTYHFVPRDAPLAQATLEEVQAYQPRPLADEELDFLGHAARRLRRETDYALLGWFGGSVFEGAQFARGWLLFMQDLKRVPELAAALVERLAVAALSDLRRYLDAVGEWIDVIGFGDDLGVQGGLQIHPDLYRRLVKPYHRQLYGLVHQRSRARVLLHSCGSVYDLIPDLIEAGVDILNPLQTSAVRMEPQRLKDEFGQRLTFWGGGSCPQHVLPFGTPQQVAADVRERLRVLTCGGGYVFAPIHDIQPDVPPQNVVAMFETARDWNCENSTTML